jgi:hypothetical protein
MHGIDENYIQNFGWKHKTLERPRHRWEAHPGVLVVSVIANSSEGEYNDNQSAENKRALRILNVA